ncbi:MAG: hypothetical protein U1F65_10770 [Verrucomicrobiota bacterium]
MNLRLILPPLFAAVYGANLAHAQNAPTSIPADLPQLHWHLTARPWQPVNAPRSALVDQMDKAIHAMAPMQHWNPTNSADKLNGAIIDPFDHKPVQYGTPLFAFNVATLLREGRGADLAEAAARALDHATLDINDGMANDYHGEFFCAPMVKALRVFDALQTNFPASFTPERIAAWKQRMTVPRQKFMALNVRQNWRTFAAKGEWLRQQDGYIHDATAWIELNWTNYPEGHQRERFRRDLDQYQLSPHFFFYHDDTADPETFAYNGATTANLLDALESGYDGAAGTEMREIIYHALQSSLLILGGSGEAAGGGRTGEHIWDDSIYANAFALMAEAKKREGDLLQAGRYRHAVQLLLQSHARFQQESGWFSITKNAFPPAMKNRYASWSGVANYLGFTLACCAETLLATKSEITEQPVPNEIGGYVMQLDPEFASAFANAGGMQAQICTRGETDNYGNVQWHVLGITRFSRTGWDGRLGPGAGHVKTNFTDGVSFSPTYFENGEWKRVCLQPKKFEGRFTPEFAHPLLVRGTFTIAPTGTNSGPSFALRLTLTPDGALVDTARTAGTNDFGILWPLLAFDGRTVMNQNVGNRIAATAYPRMSGTERILPVGGRREWTQLDGGDGGPTRIGFRYTLGQRPPATHRARLVVNGVAQPDLVFLATGQTNFWHQLYVPVTLRRGTNNSIRMEMESAENFIVDELRVHPAVAAAPEPDQQNFLALKSTHHLSATNNLVRGGYGDFLPVRVTDAQGGTVETFVYPRNAGDPSAESVQDSFKRSGEDFSSVLGRVQGKTYVGRTAAGGEGNAVDLNGDGRPDVTFSESCAFVLQLDHGRVKAVETDRAVSAQIAGKSWKFDAYQPVSLDGH